MIRKSGWLVFIVFFAALLALVYLVAGPAIRLGMVYSLEKAVGAEVNISKVSLELAPLALRGMKQSLDEIARGEFHLAALREREARCAASADQMVCALPPGSHRGAR